MTTLELIEQKMEVALQAINAILPEGYFVGQALSSTDFGNSGYIIIKKECPIEYLINVCKVRISDHSATNTVRQATEIMIDLVKFNIDELILKVERAVYPERFEQVEIRTLTNSILISNFEVGKKPFTTLSQPTFLGEVTTKKGNAAHKYSWLKEEVTYAWVKKAN